MLLCDTLESQREARERVREQASRSVLHRLTSASAPWQAASNEKSANTKGSTGQAETLASAWQRLSDHFEVLLDQPETVRRFHQSILQLAVQGKLVPQDPSYELAAVSFVEAVVSERTSYDLPKIKFKQKTFDEALGETQFPIEWSCLPLADVALAIVDCPHSTPKWTEAGKVCVRTNQFQPGFLDLSESRYVSQETYQERIQRLEPRENDILYSREGGILGVACRIPPEVELCLGQRMMLLRPPTIMDAGYLELVLNAPFITKIAKGKTTGAAAPRVNVATVKAYPIPVPPLAEQKRIVSKVSILLSQCDELSAQLLSRQSTTDALLTALIHQVLDGAA